MPIGTPSDTSLWLDDGAAAYAPTGGGVHTGYGVVSGAARIFDSGASLSRWDGVAVFNVNAIDTSSGDESYILAVEGSNVADFSSGVQTLATVTATVTGQLAVPLYSVVNLTNYRYFRLSKRLSGTTPSITVLAFVLPLTGVDALSEAELTKVMGLYVDNFFGAISALQAWSAGTATGGPNNDGRYPLPTGLGSTTLVECPAKIAALAVTTGFTDVATASEALSAGNLCNLSPFGLRKASAADLTKPANCFVLASYGAGAAATIFLPGQWITGLSLTPKATYFLDTTAGGLTGVPPSSPGAGTQIVGVANAAGTALFFQPQPIVGV